MYEFNLNEVCARKIKFEIENEKVKNIVFVNGCDGNLKGISALSEGMKVEDIIERLSGITCGRKNTSCPDQFAKVLKENF